MRTLIKNGTIVTAVDQYRGDVLVEDEKITLIGSALTDIHADKTIDASGRYVLPGGIDVHTHLDMVGGRTVRRHGGGARDVRAAKPRVRSQVRPYVYRVRDWPNGS